MNINEAFLSVLYSLLAFFSFMFVRLVHGQTYEIYENTPYGIQSAVPSKTVEVERNRIVIYDHYDSGVQNPFPEVEIYRAKPKRKAIDLSDDSNDIILPRPKTDLDWPQQDLTDWR